MLCKRNPDAYGELDAVSAVQLDNMLAHYGAEVLSFRQRCPLTAGKKAYGKLLTAHSAGNAVILVYRKYFTGEIDQSLITRYVPVCIID
ncbi:hypothetical protein D3C73_1437180 [compost metagenome]